MKKILIIDGFSIIFRAYYGSAYGQDGIITNQDGTPINALLTFNNMLFRFIGENKPDQLFVAYDHPSKTKRHEEYEGYKAGRSAAPDELKTQIPLIMDMVDALGIQSYRLAGWEADDIIASLALKLSKDHEVFIVSSDRDLLQIVGKNIKIILPQNGAKPNRLVSESNFRELIDIDPKQIPDYKGIVGDTSDNLPGVKGIGDKGAIKLITEYKSLEAIYDNIESISSDSIKTKLTTSKEMAFKCKSLATLNYDIKVPFIDELTELSHHPDSAIVFYERLFLNSLVRKFKTDKHKTPINKGDFGNLVF